MTALVTDPRTIPLTPARALEELVRIPSVSGEEGEAVARFAEMAAILRLSVEIDKTGNAIASRLGADPNADDAREIILLGHIDTVPGDIPVRIEEGVLHGRGAVDAKGPLVAMLIAAARADIPPNTTLRVIASVGEETAHSPGARAIAARFRPDACIIGEPSGWDGVTLGYKGRLLARATIETDNAHSAGPSPSPADIAFAWRSAIQCRIDAHGSESSRLFDQIQVAIQAMRTGGDGLSQRCDVTLGFRLPPGVDPEAFAADISADLRSVRADASTSLIFEGAERACFVERDDPVVQSLSAAIRASDARPRPRVKTGTADFNVVGPIWRCPIAAYGPGDSRLDHTPNEQIDLTELDRSVDVLARALPYLVESLMTRTN